MHPDVNVKDLRERLGITQLKLAKILKVRRQAISNWEMGIRKPSISHWHQLWEIWQKLEKKGE
jgi:DNA-binding XRE family transcriptional regulator